MEIVNTDRINLELAVFEKDILKVKKEQKILFKIPEASQDTFEAKVHLVGNALNDNNRTIPIYGHILDQAQTNFIVGMFVEAAVIHQSTAHYALPNEAITKIDNDYFALALTNRFDDAYQFEKIKLNIGQQN